jgi:hypothetical protein
MDIDNDLVSFRWSSPTREKNKIKEEEMIAMFLANKQN